MKNIVFILEERSAEELLKGLLPRLSIPEVHFEYIVCEGKQDLEKQVAKLLNGWQTPNSAFIVLLDQDQENCKKIKKRLLNKFENIRQKYIIRIACRELESWYFGDLTAVEKALHWEEGRLIRYRDKKQYRVPDKIQNPAKELRQITKGFYQKISGSRAIGPELSLTANRSDSFNAFIKGVRKITE